MSDVARAAGVSVTTVSHVLNETRVVHPQTAKRVREAIKTIGYRRNALAAALVKAKTQAIGVSISAAINPYFSGLMHAIDQQLTKREYSMMLGDVHEDPQMELSLFDRFLDWQVDGLICAPTAQALTHSLPKFSQSGKPIVLVDRFVDFECDQVAPDNYGPVRQLTMHLIGLGHTKIAVLKGKAQLHSSQERLAGFEAACREAGLKMPAHYYLEGDSRRAVARTVIRDLFRGENWPTAIISLNNAMTIGALQGLRDLDIKVPEQVALCSYDDFEWAELFHPTLTAVEQDIIAMGQRAVQMLMERIDGYDGPARRERIPVKVHIRESSGAKLR